MKSKGVAYCSYLFLILWGLMGVNGDSGVGLRSRSLESTPEQPSLGKYRLIETSAHDSTCFTQGYFIKDGYLYESCGLYGHSSLRKIDVRTGAVVKHYKGFSSRVFAEGITILGGRLYMLTWQTRQLYVFDLNLKHLFTTRFHSFRGEGWGLTNDGEYLIATDGSSRIMYLSVPNDESEEAKRVKELIVKDSSDDGVRLDLRENEYKNLHVRDSKGEVKHLNDLELVNGLMYLNVWYKDVVVVVDPTTAQPGQAMAGVDTSVVYLKAKIDMTDLYPVQKRMRNVDCLNGIAYDLEKKEFHLTGKLWPHKYRMQLSLTGGTPASDGPMYQKKRRRRRAKTESVSDRDLEGSLSDDSLAGNSTYVSSSSNDEPPHGKIPKWVPGLILATGMSCLFVFGLLVLLVWIERGYDDIQEQRYVYTPVSPGRKGSAAGVGRGMDESSANFSFPVGDSEVGEVEMQMSLGSMGRYVDRRK